MKFWFMHRVSILYCFSVYWMIFCKKRNGDLRNKLIVITYIAKRSFNRRFMEGSLLPFFFFGNQGCPDQLMRTTTNPQTHWIPCKPNRLFIAIFRYLHDSFADTETIKDLWKGLEKHFSQGNATWVHKLKKNLYML
jgi:hypothetical protein